MTFARTQLDELLHRLFIKAPATSLRDEDRRKSDEMAGLLAEVEAAAQAQERSIRSRVMERADTTETISRPQTRNCMTRKE